MSQVTVVLWVTACLCLTGCGNNRSAPTERASADLPTGDLSKLQDDDGQWLMAPKNYAATRFSGLNDITTENVGQLQLAWSFSTGVIAGHEAAPSSSATRCISSRRTRTSCTRST